MCDVTNTMMSLNVGRLRDTDYIRGLDWGGTVEHVRILGDWLTLQIATLFVTLSFVSRRCPRTAVFMTRKADDNILQMRWV